MGRAVEEKDDGSSVQRDSVAVYIVVSRRKILFDIRKEGFEAGRFSDFAGGG